MSRLTSIGAHCPHPEKITLLHILLNHASFQLYICTLCFTGMLSQLYKVCFNVCSQCAFIFHKMETLKRKSSTFKHVFYFLPFSCCFLFGFAFKGFIEYIIEYIMSIMLSFNKQLI